MKVIVAVGGEDLRTDLLSVTRVSAVCCRDLVITLSSKIIFNLFKVYLLRYRRRGCTRLLFSFSHIDLSHAALDARELREVDLDLGLVLLDSMHLPLAQFIKSFNFLHLLFRVLIDSLLSLVLG